MACAGKRCYQGKGTNKSSWTGHGSGIPESKEVWMAAIGPDTPALGEMKQEGLWYPAMLARTVFQLLGMVYPDEKAGAVIDDMIQ